MIRIRQEQFDILSDSLLCDWVTTLVSRQFPAKAKQLGAPGLHGFIAAAIAEAKEMGFSKPADAASYSVLTILFGHRFCLRHEWARRILDAGDPAASADTSQVMADLYGAGIEALRVELQEAYAAAAGSPAESSPAEEDLAQAAAAA